MNISYVDMWPGFDIQSNWFNLLFKDILEKKDLNFILDPNKADLIVCSTFGNEKSKYNALKIFYTGENYSPNLTDCDYSLSFDFDSYNNRNFRLPHWYLYINWWGEPNFIHAEISMEMLKYRWSAEEIWNRENFCSIVIGNPVQNRLEVAYKLNEYRQVHGYGTVFNQPFSGSKIDLLKHFRFNICFENTVSTGYITEKLLQAKVAGCVPIYYGDYSVYKDFNAMGFINYNSIGDSETLKKYIQNMDKNKNFFSTFAAQPLFKVMPNLDRLYSFLIKIFKDRGIL